MRGASVSTERATSSTCFQRASAAAMRAQAERRAMIFAARAEPRAMIIHVTSGAQAGGIVKGKRQKVKGKGERREARVPPSSTFALCLLPLAFTSGLRSGRGLRALGAWAAVGARARAGLGLTAVAGRAVDRRVVGLDG